MRGTEAYQYMCKCANCMQRSATPEPEYGPLDPNDPEDAALLERTREAMDEPGDDIPAEQVFTPDDRAAAGACLTPHPHEPLRCQRAPDHDGPHQNGERKWGYGPDGLPEPATLACPECGIVDDHKLQCATGRGYSSQPVPGFLVRQEPRAADETPTPEDSDSRPE